ncbi:hypothetical protein TeGR_g2923, partial [Tetraparma gracilis]
MLVATMLVPTMLVLLLLASLIPAATPWAQPLAPSSRRPLLAGLDADVDKILSNLEAEKNMSAQQALRDPFGVMQDTSGVAKYMPSAAPSDPVASALAGVLKAGPVLDIYMIDSRWNGNEVFRYTCDAGGGRNASYFVKLNRVEDASVFVSEAVSLSALGKAGEVGCPLPLHIGKLPKVGDIGPGAFMVLEHLDLLPFGSMRSDVQVSLATQLAALHSSSAHDDLHKGRFGFPASNFQALTPVNNTWCDTWSEYFSRRLASQLSRLTAVKAYGGAVLQEGDVALVERGQIILENVDLLLGDPSRIRPSLVHGDLWIGNTGATADGAVFFDPACSFAHHEFELPPMLMFAGYTEPFWDRYFELVPKAEGFATRSKLYSFYHYLNQLNLFGDQEVKK